MKRVREIIWWPGREEHIWERHQITRTEVEEAVYDDPDGFSRKGRRSTVNPGEYVYFWYAQTEEGRLLIVIGVKKPRARFLILTARDADVREAAEYQRRKR